ncbi:MAG: rhomboid family intramembrane serine protease [Hyphomicrobiaceae bacterium]
MFVPLSDENALKSIPFQYVTVSLIAINVIVFLLTLGSSDVRTIASFAVVPAELVKVGIGGGPAYGPLDVLPVPERYTLVSYMFLHGSWMHLISNMLFLWVFGDNVEDAMGHMRFLMFYLACGIVAGLVHTMAMPSSPRPLVGASGAVAGIVSAYLMLHPRVNVWVLVMRYIPLRLSATIVLGVWIAIQVVMVSIPQQGAVAWWAHIGGLIAGAVLILFMRRPGVVLFDRGLSLR